MSLPVGAVPGNGTSCRVAPRQSRPLRDLLPEIERRLARVTARVIELRIAYGGGHATADEVWRSTRSLAIELDGIMHPLDLLSGAAEAEAERLSHGETTL